MTATVAAVSDSERAEGVQGEGRAEPLPRSATGSSGLTDVWLALARVVAASKPVRPDGLSSALPSHVPRPCVKEVDASP